jgi:hypothetical protein
MTVELDTQTADAPIAEDVVAEAAPATEAEQQEATFDPAAYYGDETDADPGASDDEGEADPDADPDADTETEAEPIDAPLSWAKDAKEVFATLPREAQEIIATRERDREVAVQAKFREAAQTRQVVETEARTALQTIMTNHQQALAQYAAQIEVQQPDPRLLNSEDPAHRTLYFQQEAAYRAASAQREQLTQQMQEAQQHAEAIAHHQQQAELQAEHELLEEKLGTDWSDPSSRAKLLETLTPIAAELGYPQELIRQARACDILAMKNVATLKAKAEKWDAYNKTKMVPVRAARGNPIPPTARAGSPVARQQAPKDIVSQLYPNDVRRN